MAVGQGRVGKLQNQISIHLDEILELQRPLLFHQVFLAAGQGCLDEPNPWGGLPYPAP